MKLIYLGVLRNLDEKKTLELASESHLDNVGGFMARKIVGNFLNFYPTTVASQTRAQAEKEAKEKGTKPQNRCAVSQDGYLLHVYDHPSGVAGVAVTDDEYPLLVVQDLLSKVVDEFITKYPRTAYMEATQAKSMAMPELKKQIELYQNPADASNIVKIQNELDETMIVLHKNIEAVMQRGEKIDDLVAKSDVLSSQSKMFYTQAKKQNSCCIVM